MSVTRHVIFGSSAFNSTEPKEYFINDGCFGDDLCKWLIAELRKRGCTAQEEPGQEDFGWYLFFNVGGVDYTFIVSYRPAEDESKGDWMGAIERRSGVSLIGFFLGGAERRVQIEAPAVIHSVLSSFKEIHDIRWYEEKDIWEELNPKSKPSE